MTLDVPDEVHKHKSCKQGFGESMQLCSKHTQSCDMTIVSDDSSHISWLTAKVFKTMKLLRSLLTNQWLPIVLLDLSLFLHLKNR